MAMRGGKAPSVGAQPLHGEVSASVEETLLHKAPLPLVGPRSSMNRASMPFTSQLLSQRKPVPSMAIRSRKCLWLLESVAQQRRLMCPCCAATEGPLGGRKPAGWLATSLTTSASHLLFRLRPHAFAPNIILHCGNCPCAAPPGYATAWRATTSLGRQYHLGWTNAKLPCANLASYVQWRESC